MPHETVEREQPTATPAASARLPEPWSDLVVPAGWSLRYFPETGSTNDLAKEAGLRGAPARTLFLTDHQTMGRGRLDRAWHEAPGTSLLISVLFRSPLSPIFLTIGCSVAACRALEALAAVRVEIKWPNDLMVSGRKLAGVLTETSWAPDSRYAVVGMGINLNFEPSTVVGIPGTATSLLVETGTEVSRARLLEAILREIDLALPDGERLEAGMREEWVGRLWRRRQRIAVADGEQQLEGVFEDVSQEGVLLLRMDDGSLREVLVGDVQT